MNSTKNLIELKYYMNPTKNLLEANLYMNPTKHLIELKHYMALCLMWGLEVSVNIRHKIQTYSYSHNFTKKDFLS